MFVCVYVQLALWAASHGACVQCMCLCVRACVYTTQSMGQTGVSGRGAHSPHPWHLLHHPTPDPPQVLLSMDVAMSVAAVGFKDGVIRLVVRTAAGPRLAAAHKPHEVGPNG